MQYVIHAEGIHTAHDLWSDAQEQIDALPEGAIYEIDIMNDVRVVKNLMTGGYVAIEADTPASCDPSTETYWSM